MEKEVKELMKKLGAKSYKKGISWKGYDVYIPLYEGDPIIGLPLVVLEKDGKVRLSDDEECLEYLDYEQSKKGKEKSKTKVSIEERWEQDGSLIRFKCDDGIFRTIEEIKNLEKQNKTK